MSDTVPHPTSTARAVVLAILGNILVVVVLVVAAVLVLAAAAVVFGPGLMLLL